jgi:imidazolonepropionase-like amidohydrolase
MKRDFAQYGLVHQFRSAMRIVRLALMVWLVVIFVLGVFGQAKVAAQAVRAVRFGKLWDGHGKVWTGAIVIVDGEKIRSVITDASAIPQGAEVINLSKYTGLPGLIDVHTHMTMYTDEKPGEPMLKQIIANSPAVEVFLARKGAMRTLECGVTTVRDLGADQYMDIAMRDLINHGEMIGPRMVVVGYGLYITNTPYKPGLNLPAGGLADGVPEVLRVVRQQIAAVRTGSRCMHRRVRMMT